MIDLNNSKQKRWLITGASGRVGRMLGRYWQQEPPNAVVVLQTRTTNIDGARDDNREIFWDPLTNPLPLEAGKIDCIIAYAGITPTHGTDMEQNAALAEATLVSAFQAGIGRVLLTPSSAIYGAPTSHAALREDDFPSPVNDYGRSKLAMEAICNRWRKCGLEVCCLRIGNVAGADALLMNGLAARDQLLNIDRSGPVALWCRSFDRVMCSKGDELWDKP